MHLKAKLANLVRGARQVWGTYSSKRNLWNEEFTKGRWDYIDNTLTDCVYAFIAKYARGGAVLDLGCGSGNTGNELDGDSYSQYTGVDISDVAVARAKKRSDESNRSNKNQYFQSDILNYVPNMAYDLILFRESIFYVPTQKIKRMLNRYAGYLCDGGVFVVRMCNRHKYGRVLEIIERNFVTVEKHCAGETTIIIIFRRF